MPPECRGHEAPSLAFVSHRGVPDARQCLSYDKKQGVEQLCIARVPSGGADESASSPHRASIALSKLRLGIAMAGLVPVSGLLRVGIGACFLLSLLARAKGSLAYTPVPMLSSPFFDGWFVRLTDLEQGLSCAVIVGSLRHSGAREFSQHYIALSYSAASMARRGASSPDELQSVHVFPDPRDVKITLDGCEMKGFLGEADWRSPAAGRRSLKWSSASHGFIQISGSCTRVDFTLPGSHGESVSLRADLGEIQPWGASRAVEDGPEGWLGKVGFMLPCRYFVQSLASRTTYSLRRSRTRAPADAAAAPGASPAAAAAAGAQWHRVDTALSGMALSHVETNYGAAFPSGWIYIQGVGRDGVSVLVTGGEFGIGPVAPLTYIVAVRGPGGQRWDFRTTDASVVKVSFSCEQRVVRLVARSVLGYGRVDLLVRDGAKKHDEQAVWVPMRTGFSCQVCPSSRDLARYARRPPACGLLVRS